MPVATIGNQLITIQQSVRALQNCFKLPAEATYKATHHGSQVTKIKHLSFKTSHKPLSDMNALGQSRVGLSICGQGKSGCCDTGWMPVVGIKN